MTAPADGYAAVLVPADEARPCTRITLPHPGTGGYRDGLRRLVGDSPEAGRYDRDAVVYVGGDSAATSPPNRRVTRYVWGHSEAAAQHQADPESPAYWLHGDAVITGSDDDQDPADVPARILVHFGVG